MTTVLLGIFFVLALMAATGGTFAAVWARSSALKVDDLAAIVIPLLARLKQTVDPDPMGAAVVAAGAAPAPPIVERASAPAASFRLPVLAAVTEAEEEERRESAPVHALPAPVAGLGDDASEDAGRATIKTPARPGDDEPYTEAEKAALRAQAEAEAEARSQRRDAAVRAELARAEAETRQDEADARWRDGAPSLLDAVEPPITGPSVSGERARRVPIAIPPVDARGAVVVRLPPPPAPPPPDIAAVRRYIEQQAARFGAEDAEDAVREAREQRQRADAARVAAIADEALRPSAEPEERTKVYSGKVDLGKLLAVPPLTRALPGVAAPVHPAGPRPPSSAPSGASLPPAKPRARADSSPTLTSNGVVRGPRQRFDPRVEPESRVEVTSVDHRR